jgi:hypothetical protein
MTKFLKQLAFIAIASFFTISGFAQTTTHTRKTHMANPAMPPDQSKMLCKPWQLDSLLIYGVESKPSGKGANDGITFVADSSFFITQDGIAAMGKWMYAAGGHVNTTTTTPDKKSSFKIVTLTDGKLVLDYQYPAPDLSRVRYIYIPKSK